jgi:hypothetical protein
LVADPLWSKLPNLYEVPFDAATARALLMAPDTDIESAKQEEIAQALHAKYVVAAAGKLPPNMRPWERLPETFRRASLEQARCCIEILSAAGFAVNKHSGRPAMVAVLNEADVERMAALEHGRWNIERLRDGWRFGKQRDDARKMHDCMVSWEELPEEIRQYDREAVRAFPEVLAKVGLEIVRAATS